MTDATIIERPIFCEDLKRILGISSTNTLRRQIIAGRVPEPDVQITHKTRYWHRSTLVKAGLIPASQPTPATSPDAPA